VAAGFIVKVDDVWLPALWDRIGIQMGLDAFKKRCMLRDVCARRSPSRRSMEWTPPSTAGPE